MISIMISIKKCDIAMERQMRKFYTNIKILSRKFSNYSPDVKCTLFKSFCSNMYCSTLWYYCTVTAMRRLRIAYNNTLLGIPKHNNARGMFVQLNIKSFSELLRSYIHSFMNRLQCSNNLIFSSICESTVPIYFNFI